ncbi:MAG: hypothetical protein U9R25_04010 [Chloroflexota bacterium]|nr:hypothetical protein [Chloroflexota bacterium]
MEVLYLAEGRRIEIGLHDLMQVIGNSQKYSIAPEDGRRSGLLYPTPRGPDLELRAPRIQPQTPVGCKYPIPSD